MIVRAALRSALLGLLLALLILPFGGSVAAAHGVADPEPGPTLPRVLSVEPAVAGLSVTVVEGGLRLRLDNRTEAAVDVRPPAGAGRGPEPVVPAGGSAAWADPRMTGDGGWAVPLLVGDRAVTVRGDRVHPAQPQPVPWWSAIVFAAAATFCVGALAVERGRRSGAAAAVAGLTVLVVGAHVVHVLGSASVLADPLSPGTVLGAAGPGLVCWLLGAAGAALTLTRQELGLPTCASAGAIAALLTVFDTAGFHRPVLAFAWAFDVDRLTTVVTVGAGVGLFLTGCAAMRTAGGRENAVALIEKTR
ncbi:hypothetical protein [Pseudonocardia aurantiaca]|uniref:Uncharacterized protein n=1 Tax=Pseudonocardia aurantiaca TaxID=75290 RepID=A0ABW4FI50_9PSEU